MRGGTYSRPRKIYQIRLKGIRFKHFRVLSNISVQIYTLFLTHANMSKAVARTKLQIRKQTSLGVTSVATLLIIQGNDEMLSNTTIFFCCYSPNQLLLNKMPRPTTSAHKTRRNAYVPASRPNFTPTTVFLMASDWARGRQPKDG